MHEEHTGDHCGDLDHLASEGILDGDWDSILAHIVDAHGADGAPTEDEFFAEVTKCANKPATQGPPKPHEDGAAQIKDDDMTEDDMGDHDHCEDLAHLASEGILDGDWDSILAHIVDAHGADGAPTKDEFYTEVDKCKNKPAP